MTDELFDISKFVKLFDMTMTTNFKPKTTDNENLEFVYEYKPPTVDINFEADPAFVLETLGLIAERKSVMKMEQRGKYWFDHAYDAEIVMKQVQYEPETGKMTAEYESGKINDLTDRGLTARFLRWILRR